MISEIFEALLEAGASQEKARAAAEAVASEQLATKADMRSLTADLAVMKAELAIVKWLVGGVGFGVALLVLKTFWPA